MDKTIKVKLPKIKSEFKNILRWEEDGGRIVEADSSSLLERHLIRSIRPSGHNRSWFRHYPKKGGTR